MQLRFARVAMHCAWLSALIAAVVLGPLVEVPGLSDAWAAEMQGEIDALDAEAERELRILAVEERELSIVTELASLKDHAWAGEYYIGDGLGTNITYSMSPNAGVSVQEHGCLGLYGANEGLVVTQSDGTLALRYNHSSQDGRFEEEFVPVRWGQRHYMIPPAAMLDFVNAVHLGEEPRNGLHGRFPLIWGDEELDVAGLPELPPPYRGMIRRVAIKANVLSLERLPDRGNGDFCPTKFRLAIDRGTNDGLLPGVELQPSKPFQYEGRLLLDYVDATHAEGTIQNYEPDCTKLNTLPSRDWTFTTGSYEPTR